MISDTSKKEDLQKRERKKVRKKERKKAHNNIRTTQDN
jgi:hypothetical protein